LTGQLSLYTSQNDSHPYVVNSVEDYKTANFAPEPKKNETVPTNETVDGNNTRDNDGEEYTE
jgi:hypothetical protein